MTAHGQEKDDLPLQDPAVAGNSPEQDDIDDQPLDVDGKEKEYLAISSTDSLSEKESTQKRAKLEQIKSYATSNSAFSQAVEEPPTKGRHQNLNPLKWGKIPPVPEEREVCREYNAGFFSLVYFQWIAPLMSVRSATPSKVIATDWHRWGINGNSNKMIYGQSTPIGRRRS